MNEVKWHEMSEHEMIGMSEMNEINEVNERHGNEMKR